MKRIIITLLATMLLSTAVGQTQKPRGGAGDTGRVKKVPKGVVLEGKRVKLKAGYKFVRKTQNTVAIALIRTGEISGEFSCGCHGEKTTGSCNLFITKNIMLCEQGTCTGTCELSAIIKGPKGQSVIY